MAQSIEELQQIIIAAKVSRSALDGLTSDSAVAEWLEWTYVIALCENTLSKLLDFHKEDVNATLATKKPHSLKWYADKAKLFQMGVALPADSDVYADPDPEDDSVFIIKQSYAEELPSGKVRVKVATGNPLAPLTSPQLAAFSAYMQRVKDGGVRLVLTSTIPDELNFGGVIYYDPLVLDADGKRLDGTNDTPVKDAVVAFLAALPFNGLFVKNKYIAALEAVDGVRIVKPTTVATQYALMGFVAVDVEYTPDSGYLVMVEAFFDANVTYVAHGPLG